MKITVLVLCLVATATGVLSDSVQTSSSASGDAGSYNSGKRESKIKGDGTANTKSSSSGNYQGQQQYSGYAGLGSFAAATTPHVFYARPEGGIQYAASGYKGPMVGPPQIFIPQFAFAQQSPDIKSAGHIPLAYAHPGQIQYLALAQSPAELKQPGLAHPAILPFQGHQIQFALAPYAHPVDQLLKGGGVTYAGAVPQLAYLAAPQVAPIAPIAKVAAPVPTQHAVLEGPQPGPAYAYSIQPSIQIAAGKQIVNPTVATPHYKHLSPPPATSYATFSQQLPVATAAPVKVSPAISHHHVYPTAESPLYPSAKVSYRSVDHAVQNAADYYSQPSAFHYGTHLYHPSSFAKFSPFFGTHHKYY